MELFDDCDCFASKQTEDANNVEVASNFGSDVSTEYINTSQLPEFTKWARPHIPELDPSKDSLSFLQIDIKYEIISTKNQNGLATQLPIIRMFGVTAAGNSVCCNVDGFLPYFYTTVPNNYQIDQSELLRNALNLQVRRNQLQIREAVAAIESVESHVVASYRGNEKLKFLKITVATPECLKLVTKVLENTSIDPQFDWRACEFFETNIDYEMRFMVDADIVGCSWIELPANAWTLRQNDEHGILESFCQLEVDTRYNSFYSHKPEGDWAKIAPLRIFSISIKCINQNGGFPDSKNDPVVQIANVLIVQNEKIPMMSNLFSLGSCSSIIGSDIIRFQEETKLLETWSKFIRIVDPDIITGYDVTKFDVPYLISRAQFLKVHRFEYLGRLQKVPSSVIPGFFVSRQLGRHATNHINFYGRVLFDLQIPISHEHKLRSYSLNQVSFHFLGQRTQYLQHSTVTKLFNGDENTRGRLAQDCLKVSFVTIKLLNKLMYIVNYVEMARVTGVSLEVLLNKGQSIRVFSLLLRQAKKRNFILPTKTKNSEKGRYDGGSVLSAQPCYYVDPIVVLDFASMYPSIMIAYNLCYTTLLSVESKEKLRLSDKNVHTSPNHYTFVSDNIRKGLIPEILDSLIIARKKTKNALQEQQDPDMCNILNGRQLAIKLTTNAVYGFTGAQNGMLPCLAVASSTTAYGRQIFAKTKTEIELHFLRTNGYENDAKIIYGDTDSVMVNFNVRSIADSIRLGRKAAEFITSKFPSAITLEYENVFCPYLLISKKHYVGVKYIDADPNFGIVYKGIEVVRRDYPLFIKKLLSESLEKLLLYQDTPAAIISLKQSISDLLCNRIDLSNLIITQEFTGNCKSKQVSSEVAKKMEQRNPATAPKIGDRVSFVICNLNKKAALYEKAEDPVFALENGLPIDFNHYLQTYVSKPLLRIFEPILGDHAQSILLSGAHMQARVETVPKTGPLDKFLNRRMTCLHCKMVCQGNNLICFHCKSNRSLIYQNEIALLRAKEKNLWRFQSECHRCQELLNQQIICTSSDCPTFFMRSKAQIDLNDQQKRIEIFGVPHW